MKIEIQDGTELIVKVLGWTEDWEFDHPTLILSPVIRYSPDGDSSRALVEDLGISGCVYGCIEDEDHEQEFDWRGWNLKYLNRVYSQARKGKKFPKKNYKATEYLLRFYFDQEDNDLNFVMAERKTC